MSQITAQIKKLFAPRDMTEGEPWKRIAEFSFPMLIGNFAQQLYSTVDAIVIGKSKWGYEGLAAVGNAMPILNLLLALFVGVATGAGIMVSQYFGARDKKSLSITIGNCLSITMIASLVIMVMGPLLVKPLLNAVGTLPELYDGCRDYLYIFFFGIAGFFFYNILAGVLRGLGDSITALGILVLTSAMNVVMDLLLVDKMGVAGVALATIIAQGISALLCLWKLLSMKDAFRISREALKPRRDFVTRILKLGLPSGATQAIFSGAMLLVQSLINSFGDAMFVTCNIMVMRVDGYAMLPNFSFGQAMGTFVGQNVGARKIERIRTGTKQGLTMALTTALMLTPIVLYFGPSIMGFFTTSQPLIDMSMRMMYILAAGYVAMAVTQVLSGVMRGAGDTITPMWISVIITVVIRVPLAYALVALSKYLGADELIQKSMVFVSLLCSWMLGMLINIIIFRKGNWKRKQVNAIIASLNAERAEQPSCE